LGISLFEINNHGFFFVKDLNEQQQGKTMSKKNQLWLLAGLAALTVGLMAYAMIFQPPC
jgi:hypothetical protein